MRRRVIQPDMGPVERIERGRRARAILDDSIFGEAIEAAETRFHEKWLHADTTEEREAMWAKTHALSAVEDELRDIIADGEIAASEVED